MNSLDEVIEKIKDILSQEVGGKVRDQDAARALGLSAGNLATLKNRQSLPLDAISYFCAKRLISINWMLFDQDAQSLVGNTEKFTYVRYFGDVQLSAGGGAFDQQEECEMLCLPSDFTDRFGKARIEAVNVAGDSMETTLHDHDIVFIDRDRCELRDGGIFALATTHGMFVKRVQLLPNGVVVLRSDNAEYHPIEIANDEISVIGAVRGVFSTAV